MRRGVPSAFGLGFGAGLLTAGVVLLGAGILPKHAQTSAASLPKTATASPPQLAMPLAGIDPASLKSTFFEVHSGHRHEALDIMAPRGTPVLAVAHGAVAKLFTSKPGGLTVYQFDDTQHFCYYYAHLDRYAEGLKEGQVLRTGDVLGYVGSTGNASPNAPHLHFAVSILGPEHRWWESTPIDPLPLLQAGAKSR